MFQDVKVKPEDEAKPLTVTQKVMKSKQHDSKEKPASWADGQERPADGVFWVFSVKKTKADKS